MFCAVAKSRCRDDLICLHCHHWSTQNWCARWWVMHRRHLSKNAACWRSRIDGTPWWSAKPPDISGIDGNRPALSGAPAARKRFEIDSNGKLLAICSCGSTKCFLSDCSILRRVAEFRRFLHGGAIAQANREWIVSVTSNLSFFVEHYVAFRLALPYTRALKDF